MRVWMVLVVAIALGPASGAFAQTVNYTMEGGMEVEITHPDQVISGREASISILVKNNGWEDKQDISFGFSSQDGKLSASPDEIIIKKLSQGGSHGSSIDVSVADGTSPGVNFLNVRYSQVLVANNEIPQPAIFHDVAIPIMIKAEPDVTVYASAPESIFAGAEFPVKVSITSHDVDIRDVSVRVILPDDVGFRGETLHTFSTIKRGEPVTISSRIITQAEEINSEYRVPLKVDVIYTDDVGEQKTDSETAMLVLRPRIFMELTTEGGIWIGNFFIAPYISLGTIIGIPAGALLTLLIRRKTSRQNTK